MMGYYGTLGGWGGISGFLWMAGGMLLMVGLIVLAIWAVARYSSSPSGTMAVTSPQPGPLEILQGRFARGEITEQEFNDAKRVLGLS